MDFPILSANLKENEWACRIGSSVNQSSQASCQREQGRRPIRANLSKGRDAKPRVYRYCYDGRAAEVNPHLMHAVSPCLFGVDGGIWVFWASSSVLSGLAGDDGDVEG